MMRVWCARLVRACGWLRGCVFGGNADDDTTRVMLMLLLLVAFCHSRVVCALCFACAVRLQVGDYLDAKDHEGNWYDSRVVAVSSLVRKIKVHYMGWESRWDTWLSLDDVDLSIAPLFSKVANWRDFRVNDKVGMKVNGKWHLAAVERVDRDGEQVLLRPCNSTDREGLGERWFPFWRSVGAARRQYYDVSSWSTRLHVSVCVCARSRASCLRWCSDEISKGDTHIKLPCGHTGDRPESAGAGGAAAVSATLVISLLVCMCRPVV
jgi:hypothetical protein